MVRPASRGSKTDSPKTRSKPRSEQSGSTLGRRSSSALKEDGMNTFSVETPRRFLVVPDHENPEIERGVDENGQFAIVETFVGEASRIAEETDPLVHPPGL
jgi:hypothetical protein